MARLYEVSQFPPLKVIQFDARVAVHVAAHHGLARRGVRVEVNVALAPVKVILDAHRVVGDEGLGELGIVVESENGAGLSRRTIGRDIVTEIYRRSCCNGKSYIGLITKKARIVAKKVRFFMFSGGVGYK